MLFELCTWHSLAKLRLATESTLTGLEGSTRRLGRIYRRFVRTTCTVYETHELPAETAARGRRAATLTQKKQGRTSTQSVNPKKIPFQLNTYKFHALGDYAAYIRKYGTTDNYSTQIVGLSISFLKNLSAYLSIKGEVEHKRVKKFYPRTQKKQYTKGIAKQIERERVLKLISQSDPYLPQVIGHPESLETTTANQVTEGLPLVSPYEHHQMSTETGHKINVFQWLDANENDPALKVVVLLSLLLF